MYVCKQSKMTDLIKVSPTNEIPQCQYFVIRKKRLCRMTVRPGRQYCGEHEPQPTTDEGKNDLRIPCPNDPKHTCYASKLEKHLAICNARLGETPPFIIQNINAPMEVTACVRRPLNEYPKEFVLQVIDKVNKLYEMYVEREITDLPDVPIHPVVMEEFSAADRGEGSRRHLRQVSRLLQLAEEAGLVRDHTCYVELGAGKGQLSFYMGSAWCKTGSGSRVLAVDRAALRHKRDNKLRSAPADAAAPADSATPAPPAGPAAAATPADSAVPVASRLRADLAHLALHRVPDVVHSDSVVGFAKHLCGVATDYALRCLTAREVVSRLRGVVLATCCHHRCDLAHYVATQQLLEHGVTAEELNVMLGMVSWATCGDGLNRERRRAAEGAAAGGGAEVQEGAARAARAEAGRRAKAVLDWGRALHVRAAGLRAALCRYVRARVSPENTCILATRAH